MNFTLWQDGQEYGPYDLDSVEASIESGDLSPETLARIEEGSDWKPLEVLLAELKQPKTNKPIRRRAPSSEISQELVKLAYGSEEKQVPKAKSSLASIVVLCVILLIPVGFGIAELIKKSARKSAQKEWIPKVEEILRAANRVSVLTGRGVNKADFTDAYAAVQYDWQKIDSPSNNTADEEPLKIYIRRMLFAWDAARHLWEMDEAFEKGRPYKSSLQSARSSYEAATGNALSINKLGDYDSKTTISECLGLASHLLSMAELEMQKLKSNL